MRRSRGPPLKDRRVQGIAAAPRYRLILASLAVVAAVGLFSFVTPCILWVLWILPSALIIGICAWRGMTLAET